MIITPTNTGGGMNRFKRLVVAAVAALSIGGGTAVVTTAAPSAAVVAEAGIGGCYVFASSSSQITWTCGTSPYNNHTQFQAVATWRVDCRYTADLTRNSYGRFASAWQNSTAYKPDARCSDGTTPSSITRTGSTVRFL